MFQFIRGEMEQGDAGWCRELSNFQYDFGKNHSNLQLFGVCSFVSASAVREVGSWHWSWLWRWLRGNASGTSGSKFFRRLFPPLPYNSSTRRSFTWALPACFGQNDRKYTSYFLHRVESRIDKRILRKGQKKRRMAKYPTLSASFLSTWPNWTEPMLVFPVLFALRLESTAQDARFAHMTNQSAQQKKVKKECYGLECSDFCGSSILLMDTQSHENERASKTSSLEILRFGGVVNI